MSNSFEAITMGMYVKRNLLSSLLLLEESTRKSWPTMTAKEAAGFAIMYGVDGETFVSTIAQLNSLSEVELQQLLDKLFNDESFNCSGDTPRSRLELALKAFLKYNDQIQLTLKKRFIKFDFDFRDMEIKASGSNGNSSRVTLTNIRYTASRGKQSLTLCHDVVMDIATIYHRTTTGWFNFLIESFVDEWTLNSLLLKGAQVNAFNTLDEMSAYVGMSDHARIESDPDLTERLLLICDKLPKTMNESSLKHVLDTFNAMGEFIIHEELDGFVVALHGHDSQGKYVPQAILVLEKTEDGDYNKTGESAAIFQRFLFAQMLAK